VRVGEEQHVIVGDPAERARELIAFTRGMEEAGFPDFPQWTRLSRVVARDVLELDEQLDAERSARLAIQARADRLEKLFLARSETAAAKTRL
jgi:hypothetical protein